MKDERRSRRGAVFRSKQLERLGERAASVRWIAADITEVELPARRPS